MHNTKSYSVDLRQKALDLWNSGQSYNSVKSLLKISVATLFRWKKRASLEASPRGGSLPKDIGIELIDLIAQNPGKTLAEMSENLPISASALQRRFHKAKISFKNFSYTYQEADLVKQEAFKKEVAELAPETLYYLDETGIEERDIQAKGWAPKGERICAKKRIPLRLHKVFRCRFAQL